MCGIVGWLDYNQVLSARVDVVDRMTTTMCNRGPDEGGVWCSTHIALGHRRLAVIDIAGGKQPMTDPSGLVALAYNGEIYNFQEIRAELRGRGHHFKSRSDSEVILRAYLEWGTSSVERLNGIFAFAIWDGRDDTVVLARDRMGVKPLYYHAYAGGILFASEPKAIMENPRFSPAIDLEVLPILFNPRLTMPGETPLHGLDEVLPGHVVTVSRLGLRQTVYWQLSSQEHVDDLPCTVATVRELLEDAVARQLVADVPVSCLLSGGLDSTAVAAIAARAMRETSGYELRSFCVDFLGDEEHFRPTVMRPDRDAPYAVLAAEHIGTNHATVELDTVSVLDAFPAARRARDLPSFGQFDSSMHLLFKEVRKQSTVALSAEAADEVFGGYPWFHDPRMVWRDTFPWLGDAPRTTDCLRPEIKDRIRPKEQEQDRYSALRAQVPKLPGESALDARMREVLYFNLKGPLACLLDRTDRMSMAVGLEVRVPFCDHRLVEYAWNVPWSMKNFGGQNKALLNMAVADLLPSSTLERRKSGYPGTHDPAHEAEFVAAMIRMIEDSDSPMAQLIDADSVRQLMASGSSTMTWMNSAHLLTPILETDIWMRQYHVQIR